MLRNVGECGRRLGVLALTLLIVCAFSSEFAAAEAGGTPGIPRVMMYEGYITDDSGQPLPDGPYDFRFSLYESPEGGAPVWAEEHLGVEVVDGVVQVRLGEGTPPAPLDIPFDAQYYLGVQLGDDPEMVPRLQLMTTAYAFRASVADEVPDGSITSEKLTPLSVTDEHIASVSWEKITDAPSGSPPGQRGDDGHPPTPSAVWHTGGNRRTDPEKDYVGTSDLTDLILATDGEERIRIAGDGSNIDILADTLSAKYVLSRVSPTEGAFFLADPRHGLRRTGNDDVHLYTTGGNLLLEGGNVGIGTPSPTAALHVVSTSGGGDGDIANYPVLLETASQGMAIRVVGDSDVDSDNNYLSFWDDGGMRGRIEGLDGGDLTSSWQYWYFTALDAIEIADAAAQLVGACSDVRYCVITACAPGPADIAYAAFNVASRAAQMVVTQVLLWDNLGVSYESSSGDYAEWLERLDAEESIVPGDIVGVFGGRVSRSTEGAQQVMVASVAPIILGNMPPEGTEHLYTKIAFIGQVPVKVIGPVDEGDYIVPSGLGDGTGVAVPERLMTAMEYSKVVGRAWGKSSGDFPTMVTVAVGMNQGDVARAVWKQEAAVEALRAEIASRDADVASVQAELAELREHVGSLNSLCQELAGLRPSAPEAPELHPAGGLLSGDRSGTDGDRQPAAD